MSLQESYLDQNPEQIDQENIEINVFPLLRLERNKGKKLALNWAISSIGKMYQFVKRIYGLQRINVFCLEKNQ
jgi:hypothetical protein